MHHNSMLIKIQPDAKVCRYLFTVKSLYIFRVSQHPPSGVLKTVQIRAHWRDVAVPILWPVPEAVVTVCSTPDGGCCDTRNMQSDFAINKYLHTVASSWIFINIALSITDCFVQRQLWMVGLEGLWKKTVFVTFYLLTQHLLKVLSETTKISFY